MTRALAVLAAMVVTVVVVCTAYTVVDNLTSGACTPVEIDP